MLRDFLLTPMKPHVAGGPLVVVSPALLRLAIWGFTIQEDVVRRQYLTRADETRRVKAALREAGINALVTHGRGTAWGWLEINIGAGQDFGEHDSVMNEPHGKSQCRRCVQRRAMEQETLRVAQEETGRQGEWDGQILILTQDHWNQSKRCSVSITQPWWEQYHPTNG